MNYKFLLPLLLIGFLSCDKETTPEEVDHCVETRYYGDIFFPEVSRTNVKYAESTNLAGNSQDLAMDIYQPVGDDFAKRPVIIWSFGGGFIGGSRLDMKEIAEASAKRGYVAAAIDYRLLDLSSGFPDTSDFLKVVLMASNDVKAAVRFFKADADGANKYKIDPDQVFIGGVSAGAIASLHAAYIDDGEVTNQTVSQMLTATGGIKGDSGLPSTREYSNEVQGVINMAGAIFDLNVMDANDPPVISYHGDADEVVPYKQASLTLGPVNLITLYGSFLIDQKARSLGLPSLLQTVNGATHSAIFTDSLYETDREEFEENLLSFLKDRLCE